MRTTESSVMHTARTVLQFIDGNAADLGGVPTSEARKRLDESLGKLAADGQTQGELTAAAMQATSRRLEARGTLIHEWVQQIVRIARIHAEEYPELAVIRMPRVHVADEMLAVAAVSLAQVAGQFADVFVAGGLPADFVHQVDLAAEALTQAASDRKNALANRRATTVSVRKTARATVKRLQVLNGLVRPHTKNNAPLKAAWAAARRIPRKPAAIEIVADGPDIQGGDPIRAAA